MFDSAVLIYNVSHFLLFGEVFGLEFGEEGWEGIIISLKYFFLLIIRFYSEFEPPWYSGTGNKFVWLVGGGCINQFYLLWSKPGPTHWTGTGTKLNNSGDWLAGISSKCTLYRQFMQYKANSSYRIRTP